MITFLHKISNRLMDITRFISRDRVFYSILGLCLVTASFFMGRLSTIFEQKPIFSVVEMERINTAIDEADLEKYKDISTSTIVASKKGKKYYFVWCKYASTLKEANKIYFDTEEEAKATGRSLASGCK
jgi:hypothetical protein